MYYWGYNLEDTFECWKIQGGNRYDTYLRRDRHGSLEQKESNKQVDTDVDFK